LHRLSGGCPGQTLHVNDLAMHFNSLLPLPDGGEQLYLGRQPIVNRECNIVAYELLFRRGTAGPANVTNDIAATTSVIARLVKLGIDQVLGASRGFINIDAEVLMSELIFCLPSDQVVLEILETVTATDRIVQRVANLKKAGYAFALDDVVSDSANVQALLPLVDIIKLDLGGLDDAELHRLSDKFLRLDKMLLAEKVESEAQFERCLELGFGYFQGYYFARPAVLHAGRAAPH
jgi:c-di-GMP phosphodiesterase